MTPSESRLYTRGQRATALVYGMACHVLFVIAIATMAISLHAGMQLGLGRLSPPASWFCNALLLLQFPLIHSWLLSDHGRRLLARLAPAAIGKEMTSTLFAIISSLQLLIAFLLWSPSGLVFWQAVGVQKVLILVIEIFAWILLIKSMWDSQLSLHTGLLGWWSIFRNRLLEYRGFSTQGLYRHVRQPIYASFALILWSAAVWTADQFVIAVLWTAYCLVGSAFKEKRFGRYFGEKFQAYQRRVPFWFPRRRTGNRPHASATETHYDYDVLIVGAGPVGLLLAAILGACRIRTLVAEARSSPPVQSMAIGITPPSLRIMKRFGLDDELIRQGVRIDTARVHEDGEYLGEVSFSRLPAAYRFILSLPQTTTLKILADYLAGCRSVELIRGMRFAGLRQNGHGVTTMIQECGTRRSFKVNTRCVVGCDGHRSAVREALGIHSDEKLYSPQFVMADFDDNTDLGIEAHLFFGSQVSIESFPLPGGLRRWIVMARGPEDCLRESYVSEMVSRLTGYDLSGSRPFFFSSFQPKRLLASRFWRGRVALCGDAAHVMSPIGGQGMNTGFASAELLGKILPCVLSGHSRAETEFAFYEKVRRKAFRVAAARAARGMWLGTRTGTLGSHFRKTVIRHFLFRNPIKKKLPGYFAMLTIPNKI